MPTKSSKASASRSRIVRALSLEGFMSRNVSEARPLGRARQQRKPLLTRGLLTLSRNDILLDINHLGLITALVIAGHGLFNKFRGCALMTRLIVVGSLIRCRLSPVEHDARSTITR